tara:strand:- start:19649 stop:22951 length:3303 start_codon:yes stop_codon:yes gene_type:complete
MKLGEWLANNLLLGQSSEITEDVKLPINVGDTVMMGRFKNKKVIVKSIDYNEKGDLLINGRPALKFRMVKSVKESKEQIGNILRLLQMYGQSKNAASKMIKKNYKKVAQKFRGDSDRDLAMALIGYDVIGESYCGECLCEKCWKGYKIHPTRKTKILFGKRYPNCIKNEADRKPRKKGQHRNSPNHSDLYTDENPKGTIHGLKFATVKDAEKSVNKIKSSGKSHAHKIQAAVAMEQRAKEMGKKSAAGVYRKYINQMKEKTKKKNEIGIPSPSRKMVKKMKKKGHTSVPYGSGYKKMNEKKLDLYSENDVYLGMENEKNALNENKIKKVIGVYGGRFQPFGPHHKKTFEWLQSKTDDAYITTSDIKKPPRHPLNYKEKIRHMAKMGISPNKVIKEKSPLVANNLLSKFDPKTTAVVYIFGEKDAGRLAGGRKKDGSLGYFQDYKKHRGNLKGFEEHGYFLTAPHISMKIAGMEISGTTMRKVLGSSKIKDSDRPKVFKKLFGYYDEGIYKMLTNKFKGLVDHIIPDKKIEEFLMKEGSVSVPNLSDEGLYDFFKSYDDYERVSPKHANILAGFEVIGHLIDKKDVMENDFTYEYERTPTVTFGRTVNQNTKNFASSDNPFPKHISYMKELANTMGMKILKFIGTENKGVGGQKVDGVIESEIDFYLGLDEQLDIYTKEIVEVLSNEDYKGKELLLMGGAYGHMAHPFDDKNLTFGDIKNIIDLGLQGKLDAEAGVQEKLDGQNLMISWKGKNLVVARNKGDIKRGGASVGSIKAKFKGRGNIEKAFSYALDDLSKSIGKLTDAQKKKIFDDGNNYMNLEVMYPASANVINYDAPIIVFHGALKYRGGEAIGEVPGSGRILAGMIKQIGANIGKKFSIRGPNVLKMTKSQDYSKQRAYFFAKLDRLRNQYKLSDSDKLSVYHQHYWLEWILNGANQTDYPNPPDNVVYALMKRWAFFDKSYTVPMIKRDLKEHPKFLDWVLSTDKQDHSKMVKKNMKPFETLLFEVGAEILKNLSGFLAVNPKASVQNVKKQVEKAINVVKKGGDLKKLNTLKAQMEKLNAIGGLGAVVPTEGLVFKYNGNTYKLTGAFAPINQITGLMYF